MCSIGSDSFQRSYCSHVSRFLPDQTCSPSGFQMVTAVFWEVLSGATGAALPGSVSARRLGKMFFPYIARPGYCFSEKRAPKKEDTSIGRSSQSEIILSHPANFILL